MLKQHIANIITASFIRLCDTDEAGNMSLSLINVTDIAEDTAEDIVNLVEETQSRYFESSEIMDNYDEL